MEGLDVQQEALLRKRKRDDLDKKRKLDAAAKIKLASVRQKKLDDKLKMAGGQKILMPEVFVSNYMKQQRNYVKYRRNKSQSDPKYVTVKPQETAEEVDPRQALVLPSSQRVPPNCLLMAVRIKESRNTTPQAQKVLKELGLKEVNNCAFIRASSPMMQKLLLVRNYVAWGQPTKKIVDDVIRKRGYLRSKDSKRVPISDNVLIEELLGEAGVICLEDLIEGVWKCRKDEGLFNKIRSTLWPIQLAPLKEPSDKANTKHEATGRDIKKKTTLTAKGGYLGMMGGQINDFVSQLI